MSRVGESCAVVVESYCGHVFDATRKNREGTCAGRYDENYAARLKLLLQAMPSVIVLDMACKWCFMHGLLHAHQWHWYGFNDWVLVYGEPH